MGPDNSEACASESGKRILTFESHTEPCKVGFSLDRDQGCPLCNNDCPEDDLPGILRVIGTVATFRTQGRLKS